MAPESGETRPPVLSHFQAARLQKARQEGRSVITLSPDLNQTQCEARLGPEQVVFPEGQRLSWADVDEIARSDATCFVVENGTVRRVQFYSEAQKRFYSLLPTERGAPTMLVAGF